MEKLYDNEKAYRTLASWISSGRIPHAILVEGERGSGRRTFAYTIAQAILCEGENRPCGTCRHCIKAEKQIHPDIAVYGGGEGTNSFHIDTVREMRASTAVRPNEADARVFLLTDVQNMSVQAQNALLKTIEEPVRGVHFILTCENREQMLPTIRSRAVSVMLETPPVERCAEILMERTEESAERCRDAAAQCAGNVGAALALLESEEEGMMPQARQTLLDLLEGRELDALASLKQFERDRDGFAAYLAMMRMTAISMVTGREALSAPISPLQLSGIIDIMDKTEVSLRFNANMLLLTTSFCAAVRAAVVGA